MESDLHAVPTNPTNSQKRLHFHHLGCSTIFDLIVHKGREKRNQTKFIKIVRAYGDHKVKRMTLGYSLVLVNNSSL